MSHGRKPPSPYKANPARYAKVSKSAKDGSFPGCLILAIFMLSLPVMIGVYVGLRA